MKVSCAHHWVIEEAEAALSLGRCKMCGVSKKFQNSVGADDGNWRNGSSRWKLGGFFRALRDDDPES
jgi:hypothetical protein